MVMPCLNKLLQFTVDVCMWIQTQDIMLLGRHNLGLFCVMVDLLSQVHQPVNTEWCLHPEVLDQVFETVGSQSVDMPQQNTHLPKFMPPVPEHSALAVDALLQPWQGRWLYMFPPFTPVVQGLPKATVHARSF